MTLKACNLCPRRCNTDRSRAVGWCRMDDRIHVSSIVLHRGEEPPLSGTKGIVNLFSHRATCSASIARIGRYRAVEHRE